MLVECPQFNCRLRRRRRSPIQVSPRFSIFDMVHAFFPLRISSASLFRTPSFDSLGCRPLPASPAAPAETLFRADSLRRSESSLRRSSVFSLSSSSSPRENGSLSSSGCGATLVSGCHFLFLSASEASLLDERRSAASTSSIGPLCGGLAWDLKRSGLAVFLLLVRAGCVGATACQWLPTGSYTKRHVPASSSRNSSLSNSSSPSS